MSVPEFFDVDRNTIGNSREMAIDDFVNQKLDYSQIGDARDQLIKLNEDYESVGFRATMQGRREEVDNAYKVYFRQILGGSPAHT